MSVLVGWQSSLGEFVVAEVETVVEKLIQAFADSPEQVRAWRSSIAATQAAGDATIAAVPASHRHGTLLEYELPAEGGRRTDVIILQNGRVVVMEFKEPPSITRADLDQVASYARDLQHYHEPSHNLQVVPVLVRGGSELAPGEIDGVKLVTAAGLTNLLCDLARTARGPEIEPSSWVRGAFRPVPSLVHAARLLFNHQALPRVRAAESAGVPKAVQHVLHCAHEAAQRHERHLILLTGVPGAGKTLVGLQVVHDARLDELVRASAKGAPATFLSGNGPLVTVLKYAIAGRDRDRAPERKVFVRDIHAFVREYGFRSPDAAPDAHILVFDEAQRAWDAPKMQDHYVKRLGAHVLEDAVSSEPATLLEIASRVSDWSMVLALIGEGQEIHAGEEAGIAQWADAVRALPDWKVHGPDKLKEAFHGIDYRTSSHLSLDRTLRSHVASDVHQWARLLLDEADLERCAWIARKLAQAAFPILLTRSLDEARSYARARYAGLDDRRYGLVASSRASNLKKHALDPSVVVNRFRRIDKWFCEGGDDVASACRLDRVASEFLCQGLELDLPIVCWGTDVTWTESYWSIRKARTRSALRDPDRLRRNAYRVLLTRGRDGLLIWVPPEPALDETADALRRAGAAELCIDQVRAAEHTR